ncbi:GumC family protein [Aureimonas populi]|uniref:GNVR domain-containing protein n=1 Tax=Aureimonas populi TaxID=1701758 RepID=A0ABW5CHS8_9HYPH|nr:GumC family protein [Aureimonas populi]
MFTSDETKASPAASSASLAPRAAPSSLVDPVFVARRVWRARFAILGLGLVGGALAAFIALSMPKVYHASTQMILDPRGLNLVQNEVTQTPLGLASDAALALVQSQIAVITSQSVLAQVVDRAGLTQDPEFNGTAEGPFDRWLPSITLLPGAEPEAEITDRRQLTIVNLGRQVTAARNANSFVIEVTVESLEPAKAADLANLVAQIFVEEQARVQSDTARRATDAITARLAELRERVRGAEDAVEAYRAQNQLVGVGGRLIDDEFILRINNQLAEARATITGLRVRADSMRQASVDDVVDGAFPEELNSAALLRLRQSYADLAQENAVLASRLGPRHPQRAASEDALGTARRAIATELSRIVASAQTELARAEETERALSAQIATLRDRQIETSGSFVELRQLEREVEASRAVYEAYLLRARELGEQESLNTANVRTISEAMPPFEPTGPSRKLIVLAGLILGLGLGLGIAILAALWRLVREHLAASEAVRTAPNADGGYPVFTALPVPVTYSTARPSRPQPPAASRPDVRPSVSDAPPVEPEPEPARPETEAAMEQDEPRAREAEREPAPQAPTRPEEPQASRAEEPAVRGEAPPAAEPSEPSGEMDPAPATDAQRRANLRQRLRDIGTARAAQDEPPIRSARPKPAKDGERLTVAEIRRRRLAEPKG